MVEQTYSLDSIFTSLADPTRRDILRRVNQNSMNVSQIAKAYAVSLASIAKHVSILEHAGLVRKTRQGKAQIVSLEPAGLAIADAFLQEYRELWEQRLDALEVFLTDDARTGETKGTH